MWYQRATIRSVYGYHTIKLCSSVIEKESECLFIFKRDWFLLIKRLPIKVTLKSFLMLANIEKIENEKNDCKIMFFHGRIVISFHSLSSKTRKSRVFTHSEFKMALNLSIIGIIAATALEFLNNTRT